MNRLVSWPIVLATARERGLAWPTIAVTCLLIFLAMFQTGAAPATGWFSGLAEFWLFLLTLLLGAAILASEVESGHAQLVLLRPITRAQWVGARISGAALVLCSAAALAWAASLLVSASRGGVEEPGWRIATLPLALLPHLGWLATLAALGAAARGWTNAALLVLIRAAWAIARLALPALLPNVDLAPALAALDRFFGPQSAIDARGFQPWQAAWDVFWIAGAWLLAVQLLRRRELARRRP